MSYILKINETPLRDLLSSEPPFKAFLLIGVTYLHTLNQKYYLNMYILSPIFESFTDNSAYLTSLITMLSFGLYQRQALIRYAILLYAEKNITPIRKSNAHPTTIATTKSKKSYLKLFMKKDIQKSNNKTSFRYS